MKITFADSFFKSFERIKMYETWWYKIYEFLRYDLPNFFRNIWLFRKELTRFRWYDYEYTLQMFSRCLIIMEKNIDEKGSEVPETKNLKLKKMRRAIEILNNIDEFHYIETAEKEMGTLKNINIFINDNDPNDIEFNRRIYVRADRLKEIEWEELWDIIKGTKKTEYNYNHFDGSDIRSWWD
jgi:hypothetical protein